MANKNLHTVFFGGVPLVMSHIHFSIRIYVIFHNLINKIGWL